METRNPRVLRSSERGMGQTLSAGSPIVGSREPVQMILRSTFLLRGVPRLERRVTDSTHFHRAGPR